MATDNQVKIDITAEVQGFNANMASAQANLERIAQAFDKTGQASREFSKHSDAAEAATNKLSASTGNLIRLIPQAAAAFGLYKLAEYAKDVALLNARYETLGVSMTVVGRNAGYSAAQMDDAAAAMQKTGISMIESRQQAMRLVQAHIDLSKSTELARIAQDAAVIGNMNSSDAFAAMIHGIQTGQTDVLRTIGLNISMEQSYKLMAQQLHKNADALTQNEKTQAIVNAVMRAGADIAGTYEAAMGTAGKQIKSMERYSEDLKVKQGELFNEALTVAVMAWTAHLKDANGEMDQMAANKQIDAWGASVTDTMVEIADAANRAYGMLQILGKTIALLATYGSVGAISKAGQAATAAYLEDVKAIEDGSGKYRKALDERRAARAEQHAAAEAAEKNHGEHLNAIMRYYADQRTQGLMTEAAYLKTVTAIQQQDVGDHHQYKDDSTTIKDQSSLINAIGGRKKAEVDALAAIEKGYLDQSLAALDANLKLKLIDEDTYYKDKQALAVKSAQADLARIQQEAIVEQSALGKSTKPEEKEHHLAKIIELGGKAVVAQLKLNDAATIYAEHALAKEIKKTDEYIDRLDKLEMSKADAIKSTNDYVISLGFANQQRDLEISLMGQSETARNTAIGQYQVEKELQAQILKIKAATTDEDERARQIVIATDAAVAAKKNLAAYVQVNEQMKDFNNLWSTVEKTGKDVFTHVLADGKGAFEGIGKSLKASVIDLLYQMTARKWIISIGTSLGGSMGAANAAGGSGGGGIGVGDLASIFGAGGSISEGIAAAGYFGSTALGASAATSASIGSALAAIPGWGWAAAAGLAILGGSDLFNGGGDTNRTGNWASSKTDIGLGNGSRFGYTGSTDNQWFSGAEMGAGYAQFSATLKTIDDTLATSLHLTDKQIGEVQDRLVTLNGKSYDFGMEHTDWLKSAAPGEIMKDRYGAVFDEINAGLGDLVRAAQGDANAIAATVNGLASLTQTFDAIGTPIDSLTKDLIDAAGGITALQQSTSFYYQNFYTDAERLSAAQTTLSAQFRALGQDHIPATRDEFRKLMEAQDLATESGRKAAAELFALAPALVSVTDAAQQAAKTAWDTQLQVVQNMQGWIDQVTGFIAGLDKAIFDTQLSQSSDPAAMLKSREADLWQQMNSYQINVPVKGEDVQHQLDLAGQIKDTILQRYQIETAAVQKLTGFAQNLGDYVNGLKIGDLSPLSLDKRIAEAKSQYDQIVATLRDPSASAADRDRASGKYTGAADAYLKLKQQYEASGPGYVPAYDQVMADALALGADTRTEAERQTAQLETLSSKSASTIAELQGLKSVAQGGLDYLNSLIAPEIHKLGTIADALGSSGAIATALNALPAALAAAVAGNMSAATRPNAAPTPNMGIGGISISGTVQGRDGLRDAVVLGMANAGNIAAAMSQASTFGYSVSDMADAWNTAHPDQQTTAPALAQYGKDNHLPGFRDGGTASSGYYIAHEGELIEGLAATRIFPAEQTSSIMDRITRSGGDNQETVAELKAQTAELRRVVTLLAAAVEKINDGNDTNQSELYQVRRQVRELTDKVAA